MKWLALLWLPLVVLAGCSPKPVDIPALEADLREKYGKNLYTINVVESEEACGGMGDRCPDYQLMEKAGWLKLEWEAERKVRVTVTPKGLARCRVEVESGRSYHRFDLARWELVGVDSPKRGAVIPRDVRTLEVEYRDRYVLLPAGVELRAVGWKLDESPRATSTTFIRLEGEAWRIKPYHEGGAHPAF